MTVRRSSGPFDFTIELTEMMPPLAKGLRWASRVTRILHLQARSVDPNLSTAEFHLHWGKTEDEAIHKADAEFEEWRAWWLVRHST
jgi:hypothetical protein